MNQGTFNFGPNPVSIEHWNYDIEPYFANGTGPNDPSTMFERVAGALNTSWAYDGPVYPSMPYYQPWMQLNTFGMLDGSQTISATEIQSYLDSIK